MSGQKRPNDEDGGQEEHQPKTARTADMEDIKQEGGNGPGEKEEDAPVDKRKGILQDIFIQSHDATLNIVPTTGGRVLMALSDAGMQYLVAAARANVGVKAGRYMYEVRIMEVLNPAEPGRRIAAMPRQHVRVGFSSAGSSLFLGETEDSVCFDSEGMFISDRKRTPVSQRFARGQVIAVLINRDPKSPNWQTVSLFRDGQRVSEPQQIPESLRGKTLFPHVAFRNVSLHVHFGPEPILPLPFTCRTLQSAAEVDVELAPPAVSNDGKYDVLFPVGMPDEGTFDWLESFIEKNPHYVELSDRKIVEWAERSGLFKQKTNQMKTSNDRPDVSFGIPALDELSARKVLRTVASLVPRNYVVMEVRANLLKAERQEFLRRFNAPHFRRIARVAMGEPDEAHKSRVRSALLEAKQERLDFEWKAKQVERERKRQIEMRQKQLIEQRKAALAAQMKAAEESAETAKVEGTQEGEDKGGEAKEEVKEEGKEEGKEEKAEVKEGDGALEADAEMKDKEEEEPPKAELTDEESKTWFKPLPVCDVAPSIMNASFANFTIPDLDEGFDAIHFEWQDESTSKAYLRKWVLEKKRTTKVEDLHPSEWFFSKLAEWQKVLQEWQLKQKEFRQDPSRKEAARLRIQKQKERREKEKKEKEMQEKEQQETADGEAAKDKDTVEKEKGDKDVDTQERDEAKQDVEAEKKDGDDINGAQEGTEEKEEDNDNDDDEEEVAAVDIFTVKDVCDIGEGEPLFASFMFEDWALMSLRFELLLLVKAFKKDVDDPDRPGIPEVHLPYYYNRYYRKQLNTRFFGMATVADLINMVKDTVRISEQDSIIISQLPEDTEPVSDIFVKLTEESRRDRQRRIDAGDETAKLKFSVLATPPTQMQHETKSQAPRVVIGNTAPRAYSNWNQQSRPAWQRPSYNQQSQFRSNMSTRWPNQAYAPKQQGW
eukprot:CAMPEP_0179046642 /NCGR_PEP_ID=MMETSP0796-20121207/18791_1 /TAXON_ID=73915 /ORGANISM="Pyrodinium bahamense, Strain pbaha01" /LENGTH=939 /DNA_ID=CAMNT_0020743071 /DNA_START=42 /DNA_END=2858 /DNA_ORIENTATION=-